MRSARITPCAKFVRTESVDYKSRSLKQRCYRRGPEAEGYRAYDPADRNSATHASAAWSDPRLALRPRQQRKQGLLNNENR
jgi:hypothetical protein